MVFKMRTLTLPIPRTKADLLVIHGCPLKTFSLRDLKLATNNFSEKNVVGRGGFGRVYRGRLADGSLVAIKRLKEERTSGGELQFQTEVEIGGSAASNHRNVLRLCGYCMTRKERILVYPFMVNKCVTSRLRDRAPSEPPLDWPTRKRIALGAAKALAHFHYGSSFTVIHRDVKAANILLDEQFEAVLCDFGLAKFVGRDGDAANSAWVQRPMEEHYDDEDPFEEEEDESDQENNCLTKSCWKLTRTVMLKAEDGDESRSRVCTKWSCWAFTKNEVISESGHSALENRGGTEAAQPTYHEFCTHVTTAVRGTIGHIAPEYLSTGKCTVKNDVFGYGIMLLELVSGQRAFDLARLANDDDVLLLDWVKQLLKDGGALYLMVDSDLQGDHDYSQEEIEQLIQLALLCTEGDPEKRPVMTEVIKLIENLGKRPLAGMSVQQFSLPELKLATDNFSNKNIIGKSGFSNVYRGRLQEDGSVVVVKRLLDRSKPRRMRFEAEVKLGGITKHRNLLQLRGYCVSGNERLLVYPFMPNKSLEWRLRPERSRALDWVARRQIAFGVAQGIAYLHYDCDSNVSIKRDVRPSNILLDAGFNPVLCNLRLGHNKSSQNQVDAAVCSVNDVYRYGITLFVLISGKVSTSVIGGGANDPDNHCNESGLHDMFKKLRHHQPELLLDPSLKMGDSNYETMHIKDEIDLLIQVALLCTQPCPTDRPEMWEVMQMLEGIMEGDLKACFAFDRANLFRFDESLQPQVFHELELKAMTDLPKLDSEGSVSSEFDQTNESKGKEVVSFSVKPSHNSKPQHTKLRQQSKGITILDNVREPEMQEMWKTFLSEVVSNALPTNSKLFQSGKSVDPLCPLCNGYEEDNFHLFFKCDFSRQAWLLAAGVRIDMLVFGSVKEAVDVILKPDDAGINILPQDVEPSRFMHKGVALMQAIWTHRNQVCSDHVSPSVIKMLKDHPDATDWHSTQPPSAATTQLVHESSTSTQTQEQIDTYECVRVASDHANWVQFESSHEIEDLQPQLEQVVLQEVTEPVINNKPHDCQGQPEATLDAAGYGLVASDSTNWVQFESSPEIKAAQPLLEPVILQEVTEPVINNKPHDCQEKPDATLGAAGCVSITPDHANSVQCQSSHETEPARLQPEAVVVPQVLEPVINNNLQHDFQLNISTSGGFSLSLKCNNLSVWCVIFMLSVCVNLVSTWVWDKPRY